MTNEEYRTVWLKWHAAYETQAFRIFRKALKQSFAGLNLDNVTYDNYKVLIPLNVQIQPIQDAYVQVYRLIGLTHGKRVGKGINKEIKRFDNDFFNRDFFDNIIEWVIDHTNDRVRSITETISKRITRLIEVSFERGLSVYEMRDYLHKTIDNPDFSKYDALRIARTETTTAANHAATVAGERAGIVLEKVWISTKDDRTRDPKRHKSHWSHVIQDGKTTGQFDTFEMHSDDGRVNLIMFPGDPAGSVDNIVMCRCTVAYRPMRDADGFVIIRQ
jgi:hypothetical protein